MRELPIRHRVSGGCTENGRSGAEIAIKWEWVGG